MWFGQAPAAVAAGAVPATGPASPLYKRTRARELDGLSGGMSLDLPAPFANATVDLTKRYRYA